MESVNIWNVTIPKVCHTTSPRETSLSISAYSYTSSVNKKQQQREYRHNCVTSPRVFCCSIVSCLRRNVTEAGFDLEFEL